jgi:hypothetical protein
LSLEMVMVVLKFRSLRAKVLRHFADTTDKR